MHYILIIFPLNILKTLSAYRIARIEKICINLTTYWMTFPSPLFTPLQLAQDFYINLGQKM